MRDSVTGPSASMIFFFPADANKAFGYRISLLATAPEVAIQKNAVRTLSRSITTKLSSVVPPMLPARER
jgi:hypothetical protein